MKQHSPLVISLLCCALNAQAATLAEWTFETSQPSLTNSLTISTIAPENGVQTAGATASGSHSNAGTDWSSPQGHNSNESFSSNYWIDPAPNFYQFQLSTIGYQDIQVSWDQTSSSTGPTSFDFLYSTNGVDFTLHLDNYTVGTVEWDGTGDSGSSFAIDLSAVPVVDNQSQVTFRLLAQSTGTSAGSTNRVDNFLVAATPIPEPTSLALMLLASLSLLTARRHRS